MLAPTRLSLISGVADSLRGAIEAGEFVSQLPTVRALSRDLCVSVPTVLAAVKILAEEGYVKVSQGCPTKIVYEAVLKPAPVGMASKKVVFLGFPPDYIEESVYYREVADILTRNGCVVERHQFRKKIWGLTKREFERLVQGRQADCWVLVGGPPEVQEFFAARKLTCLIEGSVARPGLAIPDFEMDYGAIYRHAANQFLNLGHRRIRLMISEKSATKNPESIDAFVQTVQARFPETTRRALVRIHDGTISGFKSGLEALFHEKEKPTALFVALVSRMIMAESWLLSSGYKIPGDVSLICRDSDEMIPFLVPMPAHYAHSEKQAIRRLVRAIMARVEHKPVKEHTLIIPEFIKGETLGPPPVNR